jgi:hypothetical protein
MTSLRERSRSLSPETLRVQRASEALEKVVEVVVIMQTTITPADAEKVTVNGGVAEGCIKELVSRDAPAYYDQGLILTYKAPNDLVFCFSLPSAYLYLCTYVDNWELFLGLIDV